LWNNILVISFVKPIALLSSRAIITQINTFIRVYKKANENGRKKYTQNFIRINFWLLFWLVSFSFHLCVGAAKVRSAIEPKKYLITIFLPFFPRLVGKSYLCICF